MYAYIYAILVNDVVIYVGKTFDVSARAKSHVYNAILDIPVTNILLYDYLNKIINEGEFPAFKILKCVVNRDANTWERKFVEMHSDTSFNCQYSKKRKTQPNERSSVRINKGLIKDKLACMMEDIAKQMSEIPKEPFIPTENLGENSYMIRYIKRYRFKNKEQLIRILLGD